MTKKIKKFVKSLCHGFEDVKEPGEILRTDKYHHGFNDERQKQEGKRKGGNSVNIDKSRRYNTDSDSDGYARDRKRQLHAVEAKKNVPERRRVASSSESSDYSGSSLSSSESDDSAYSYESQEKRKELYKHKQREEERKELEKQKQREEEIKGLEKRKELEKQRLRELERMELEKQKQREREEDRHREREQDRHREREPDRRKGVDGAERDYKRKLGEDRYDLNSSSAREDGYMDCQNKDGRRDEERHRSRDIERQDTKRSRYDDSYHRSSRGEERYSRDDYRDRRHR
jgi:serine/arginine repetitive matrix protein 2